MTEHFEYDIENGLKLIKIGIKNLINYMNESPVGTEYTTGDFHYELILDSLDELNIPYNLDDVYLTYHITTDKLLIRCDIKTGKIIFTRI